MNFIPTKRAGQRQTLRVLVASVCVLLILFIGAAQVLHQHDANEIASPGCSLCSVAHLSALPILVIASPVVAEFVAPVRRSEFAPAPRRFFFFSLCVRPPPVLTTLS